MIPGDTARFARPTRHGPRRRPGASVRVPAPEARGQSTGSRNDLVRGTRPPQPRRLPDEGRLGPPSIIRRRDLARKRGRERVHSIGSRSSQQAARALRHNSALATSLLSGEPHVQPIEP